MRFLRGKRVASACVLASALALVAPGVASAKKSKTITQCSGVSISGQGAAVAANAETLWTGLNSPNKADPPQFVEQGTEVDDLVKVNGHWLFKLRVITSNAGLQAMFAKLPKS